MTTTIVCLGIGVVTLLICLRWLEKRRFIRHRQPVELPALFDQWMNGSGVDYETFRRVFEALGRFYSVDPRLLRPSDTFAQLASFDSFFLWHGRDRMQDWFARTFEVTEDGSLAETVADLLQLARGSSQEPSGRQDGT